MAGSTDQRKACPSFPARLMRWRERLPRPARTALKEPIVPFLALRRFFRQLEIHWPRWVWRLPGTAVGTAGVHWTLKTTSVLLFAAGGWPSPGAT